MSTGYNETKPQAAYNSTNNEYLIVAEYDSNGAGLYQTRAQRVSAGGSIIGGPIDIFATANSQNSPCIAYNSTNNQYLVGIETDYTGDGKLDFLRMVLNGSGEVLSGQYNYLGGYHFKKIKLAYNTQQNEYLSVFELTDNASISYIYGYRLDSGGVLVSGTDLIPIVIASYKSTLPDVVHNPDRDEYAVCLQYDSDGAGGAYGVYIRKVSRDGTAGAYEYYSSSENSLLWPALAYFDSQNEYILTLTHLTGGGEYGIYGYRIEAGDLDLVSSSTINIATENSKIERKSSIAGNAESKEFLVGYEYDNGSDWDVKAQRVGNITQKP